METDILEISSQVNDEFTLMSLFFRADLVVKLVILMLFAASIFSWAIIIQKIRLFRNIKKLSDEFDSIFWSGKSIKEIQADFYESESFPVKNVFNEALKEIKKSESEKSIASLPDRLDTVIESSIELESEKLSSLFNYLATIGSTSPFIGLFGTVWGIMNSFQSIAISKNTSLAVVAPGIAEALFATALGLLAAIPAVISGLHRHWSRRAWSLDHWWRKSGDAAASGTDSLAGSRGKRRRSRHRHARHANTRGSIGRSPALWLAPVRRHAAESLSGTGSSATECRPSRHARTRRAADNGGCDLESNRRGPPGY